LEKLDEKIREQFKREREKKLIIITFILLLIGTAIQVYYSHVTFNNTSLPSNIVVFSLININIILIILLLFLIFRNLVKIFFDKDQKKVKKLRRKLVISFFLFTTVPTILLFITSSVIIKSSISSWFNKKVEDNLEASLKIADEYYEEKKTETIYYAKRIYSDYLNNRLKVDYPIVNGYIITNKNKIAKIECFPAKIEKKFLEPNVDKILSYIADNKNIEGTDILSIGKKEIIFGFYKGKNSVSVITFFVTSMKLTKATKSISQNITEYSYLKLMKSPIQKIYILSLMIVTAVIIFSATWFGFSMAKYISTPINKLLKATEEVGRGNLDYEIDIQSQDEIKLLVESFKKMVTELKTSRRSILERQQYIEAIINNVNSGVVSIDKNGIINTINHFVENIINIKKINIVGFHFNNCGNEVFKKMLNELMDEFKLNGTFNINKNIILNSNIVILSIFGTILIGANDEILGYLLVMTDLTQTTIAQRAAAWREVAKRVAHEIKNPLTPIQLSAQRLKRKYSDTLGSNREDFIKMTNNIIEYVDIIRNMVNEFSKFAKMPDIKVESYQLNNIISEMLPLFKNSYKGIKFNLSLDENLPKINLDRKQIYQVVTNILKNAVESFKNIERDEKRINIKTVYNHEFKKASLITEDNGIGINEEIREKIFEPYFSTKKGGTGIGLAIVKSIIESHNSTIDVYPNTPYGTIIEISFLNVEQEESV